MNSELQHKESLLSLIGLFYIEQNQLLGTEQLAEAKASLYAMFLHTAGEESILRKLINLLKTNQVVNRTFSKLSKILVGIDIGTRTINKKSIILKNELSKIKFSADEYSSFIDPLLDFSHSFSEKMQSFNKLMNEYRFSKEQEAKDSNSFNTACEERARLKERLNHCFNHRSEKKVENRIKQKVIKTFNYDEAKCNLALSQQKSHILLKRIQKILSEINDMCQMLMRTELRSYHLGSNNNQTPGLADIYNLYTKSLESNNKLKSISPMIIDLFKLFKHSHGVFNLDFHKFNTEIAPIIDNANDYFVAKEENEDIKTNQEKLMKIEGLIAFLERASILLTDPAASSFHNFSKQLSSHIAKAEISWQHISEDLLQAKVSAEAELSAQQSAIARN